MLQISQHHRPLICYKGCYNCIINSLHQYNKISPQEIEDITELYQVFHHRLSTSIIINDKMLRINYFIQLTSQHLVILNISLHTLYIHFMTCEPALNWKISINYNKENTI